MESLRGLAALVVVFCHLAVGFYHDWYNAHSRQLPPWARFWFQGTFAVHVFFVLSGYVLSLSFVRTKQVEALRSATVRRYARLTVPILACVSLSHLLFANGLYFNLEASAAMGLKEKDWLNLWFRFEPTVWTAAKEALWKACFEFDGPGSYNPVLWTMQVEFLGSLFLFAFLALFGAVRNRSLAYLAVGFVLYMHSNSYFLEFLAGAALCELMQGRRPAGPIVAAFAAFAVAVAVLVSGANSDWLAAATGVELPLEVWYWANPVAAVVLLAGVLACPPLHRLLGWGPFRVLGRMSFPLYLIHMPVECSLGCYVYLRGLSAGLSHDGAFAWAAAAVVGTSLVLAWIGTRTVEPFTLFLARRLYRAVFEPRPVPAT